MRRVTILLLAQAASACASASKPGAMAAPVTASTMIAEGSALKEAFSVGSVTGGKATSPLWKSNVSNEDFAEALRQSLAAHAMLASTDEKYVVYAELVELKQPVVAVNSKVTSTVVYKVTEAATGAVVFNETITNAYTAKMGEAFLGVVDGGALRLCVLADLAFRQIGEQAQSIDMDTIVYIGVGTAYSQYLLFPDPYLIWTYKNFGTVEKITVQWTP